MTESEWESLMKRQEFIDDQLESLDRMINGNPEIFRKNLETLKNMIPKDSGE